MPRFGIIPASSNNSSSSSDYSLFFTQMHIINTRNKEAKSVNSKCMIASAKLTETALGLVG
jgi:hypothetical protein